MEAWSTAVSLFLDSPIIGKGLGAFWVASIDMGSHLGFPHSFFFFILSELGLVGFLLFFLWSFLIVKHLVSLMNVVETKDVRIIIAGLLAGLVAILIEMPFRSMSLTEPLFWGFLGLCSAFLKVEEI
jgi:O-antigen ligase